MVVCASAVSAHALVGGGGIGDGGSDEIQSWFMQELMVQSSTFITMATLHAIDKLIHLVSTTACRHPSCAVCCHKCLGISAILVGLMFFARLRVEGCGMWDE